MTIKHNADLAYKLVSVLEVVLSITDAAFPVIGEAFFAKRPYKERDMYTLITVAIQNGIIDIVSALLAVTVTVTPSKLSLGADGTVLIEGQTIASSSSVEDKKVLGPTPALTWVSMVAKTAELIAPIGAVIGDITTFKGVIEKSQETTPPEEL
jgi:hypothetical protein